MKLQLRALALLRDATRKADEELQSRTRDFVETSSIVETYMSLANFCDKLLRAEEPSDPGKNHARARAAARPPCADE